MAQKMYRRREVEELTGRKRSALYEDIKNGKFPAPVKVRARAVAWLERHSRLAGQTHCRARSRGYESPAFQ